MIESLTGTVTGRSGSTLFFATGAVEWALEATATAAMKFSAAPGAVTIPVHLVHREDAMQLFAFVDKKERTLFRELVKVPGIGPRQAVRILSGIEADRLIGALESEDVDTLSTIPGIGRKSAGKIILALRGKLTPAEGEAGSGDTAELLEALVGMGFDRKAADKALKTAAAQIDPEAFAKEREKMEQELFRTAIVNLSS